MYLFFTACCPKTARMTACNISARTRWTSEVTPTALFVCCESINWRTPFINHFVFAIVSLSLDQRVHWSSEDDKHFGNMSLHLRDRYCGDCTGSELSHSPKSGLKGIIQVHLDSREGFYLSSTTPVFISQFLEPWYPSSSNYLLIWDPDASHKPPPLAPIASSSHPIILQR